MAAACEYATDAAAKHGFTSLAFSPMALRGHGTAFVATGIAPMWLPAVQAGVIVAFLATGRAPELERIDHCINNGIPPAVQSSIVTTFTDTWRRLVRIPRLTGLRSNNVAQSRNTCSRQGGIETKNVGLLSGHQLTAASRGLRTGVNHLRLPYAPSRSCRRSNIAAYRSAN